MHFTLVLAVIVAFVLAFMAAIAVAPVLTLGKMMLLQWLSMLSMVARFHPPLD